MKVRLLYKKYRDALTQVYPMQEAESQTLWLMEYFLKISKRDLLKDAVIAAVPEGLSKALEELLGGKPIQYILGESPFYGRNFKVGPGVLIPRNETEEMVHLILGNHIEGAKVLDIGTGSGCIAISLALEMAKAEVGAMDLSVAALAMARENAAQLKAAITFFQSDVLLDPLPLLDLDIIVSNPPYVRASEKGLMHKNVLDHEPHLALFVPDEDPLKFYRVIVKKAIMHLKKGGCLYLEINEVFGNDTRSLMEESGFEEVKIYRDLNGKDRIVWGRKPN
ncbi:MAG: peptide chain release factor N(5)-glutamine methyltransferase [Cyclobacteriaceae bacterium]